MKQSICVVVGVGPGNGAAFAHRFAKEGYKIALLARHTELTSSLAQELAQARAYECDVTDETSVKKACEQIRKELGEIDVVIYNAGSGTWGNVEEITLEAFETSWRVNALGLFNFTKEVIPHMKEKGNGSIIIVGATASRRGTVKSAAFSSAKAAQRNLAESMAKYLWPQGIHVALIIIDGIVDLPKTREQMPDKSNDFFVNPDDVANTASWLVQQPRSTWSFEVEARPFMENW
jgi:NAD(P)-dependent dehydrogenase (short-subunit alcohol dehydrogenase family)